MPDAALLGMWSGALTVLTLIVSRIRCLYKRDEHGCNPVCGCTEGSIQDRHEEVLAMQVKVGDLDAVLLLPKA